MNLHAYKPDAKLGGRFQYNNVYYVQMEKLFEKENASLQHTYQPLVRTFELQPVLPVPVNMGICKVLQHICEICRMHAFEPVI